MSEKECPKCNALCPSTAIFCASCGAALEATPAHAPGERRPEIITLVPDTGGPVIFRGDLLAAAAGGGGAAKVTLYRSEAGSYVLHEERLKPAGRAGSAVYVFKTAYALNEHCGRQLGEIKGLETELIDRAARRDARISCLLLGR